ncbi:MAG: trigger factor [Clostridia bacterium]|nr:trigger factor [Clostridia bacterium]
MALKQANKVETNRVELEIEVGAEEFAQAVSAAYRKNIGKMNIPGFRKGKAPRAYVEKIYGEGVFYEDAINAIYPSALDAAIRESGYEYVDDKVDLDVVSVGKEGLCFKAVITVKPEVEVTEYKGLKAAKKAATVKAAEVDEALKQLQDRNSRLVTVEDRAAENGDTVVFDFDGYVDGVAFDGGKSENYSLVLGSGQFIPGFEDQIVGKKTGEVFDVDVTFPEEYHAKELAGKPAVFKCKLHEIKVKELPELNDDFAKDCSEFDTLEELKADTKETIKKQKERAADEAFENELMEQLIQNLKGEIPEAMYENRVDDSVRDFGYRLQSQGLDLNTYIKYTGMEMDEFRKGFREQAEKSVKLRLALEKIVELEKIEPTEEEVEAEFKKFADQYKMEVEQIKSMIPQAELVKDLAVGKAMELVKASAVKPTKTTKAKKEEKAE